MASKKSILVRPRKNRAEEDDKSEREKEREKRRSVKRRLKTGQTVTLTPQDDRMIRLAYEYMAGYVKRIELQQIHETKKQNFAAAAAASCKSVEIDHELMTAMAGGKSSNNHNKYSSSAHRKRRHKMEQLDNKSDNADVSENVSVASGVSDGAQSIVSRGSQHLGGRESDDDIDDLTVDSRLTGSQLQALTEEEQKIELYRRARSALKASFERLNKHLSDCDKHKITLKDLDAVLRKLGVVVPKKQQEQMLWEIDEDLDSRISWDEFTLTFCRNVDTTSGTHASEPHAFFRVIEFLTFDEHRKGFCLEDDVMEVLFSRYGSYRLEKELQFLFGPSLRALGGDGTLYLERYLNVLQDRSGRRALVVEI